MWDGSRVQDNADLRAVSEAGVASRADSGDVYPATAHDPEHAEVVALMTIPAPLVAVDPTMLAGATITVVDDGQRVAPLVAGLLQSHGASARVVGPAGIPELSDGIIHLGQLHSGTQAAFDLFSEIYPVARAGATTVVTVTGLGGTHGQVGQFGQVDRFGHVGHSDGWMRAADHDAVSAPTAEALVRPPSRAGIGSLLGGLAEELPGANVRAVDLDCFDDPVVLAGRIVAEALTSGGPVAVGYRDDRRCAVVSAGEAVMIERSEPLVNWS